MNGTSGVSRWDAAVLPPDMDAGGVALVKWLPRWQFESQARQGFKPLFYYVWPK